MKAIQWDKLWHDFPVFIVSHYGEQAVSFKKVDLPESLVQGKFTAFHANVKHILYSFYLLQRSSYSLGG